MEYAELRSRAHLFTDLVDDSRQAAPGALFVAGGGGGHAMAYVEDAIRRGAIQVVGPLHARPPDCDKYVVSPDNVAAPADLANVYFGDPSASMTLLGVTGTCGKTTTTYILEAIFDGAGLQGGVIGTENIRFAGMVEASYNTTPGAVDLNRTLRRMAGSGCNAVAMEVSSHGLHQGRTQGIKFDGAIFTNLTTEHLELHGTMEDYFVTKRRLFTEYADVAIRAGKRFRAVVNCGNAYGRRLFEEVRSRSCCDYEIVGYDLALNNPFRIGPSELGLAGVIDGHAFQTGLVGEFNAENIMGAILLAQLMELPNERIARGLCAVAQVPGRMQRVPGGHCEVLVDFAHKPGALAEVLKAARSITRGKVRLVFGCGGRRDRAKRPEMARVAVQLADMVVLTADNLRGEPLEAIFADTVAGLSDHEKRRISIVEDRSEAIRTAISGAARDDVVVIAGRGTESRLNVRRDDGAFVDIEHCDIDVARSILELN